MQPNCRTTLCLVVKPPKEIVHGWDGIGDHRTKKRCHSLKNGTVNKFQPTGDQKPVNREAKPLAHDRDLVAFNGDRHNHRGRAIGSFDQLNQLDRFTFCGVNRKISNLLVSQSEGKF